MSLLMWLFLLLQLVFASPGLARVAPELTLAPESDAGLVVPTPAGGWWPEDGLYVRVWSAPQDVGAAKELARYANISAPALAGKLELPLGSQIDVYIAPTQEDFVEAQPGQPPDWADGTAWPRFGLVFLRSPGLRGPSPQPLTQVLDHELIHIILGRAFAGRPVPRWLQEGVAEVYSGEVGATRAREVLRTLSAAERFPLDQLGRGFPQDAVGAKVAYAQSVDLVLFLHQNYGPESLSRLTRAALGGAGFAESLLVATGEDLGSLDRAWASRWESPWRRLFLLADANLLFLIVGVLAVVGLFRIRLRTRRKLARWEAEERRGAVRELFLHPQVH